MKIIFLSFSDHKGGAAMAAHSIYKLVKSKKTLFLTVDKKYKYSKDLHKFYSKIYIFLLRIIEKILIFFFCKKKYHQSLNIFTTFSKKKISSYSADLINIHWINRSMISLKEMNTFKEKIVISLHDMWFFSPTEHYFAKKNYHTDFVSKYCWVQKKNFIYKKNVFFIAHNNWMIKKFKESHPILKKKIFLSKYYPINTKIFKPRNKNFLRKKYNIPLNKKVIFFSAQDIRDERKGFIYFKKIIKKLTHNNKFYFISLGKKNFDLLNIKNHKHFEFLPNDKTADFYSLSDIYICTSVIDNLPLTILEALSSGNLVVSFKNGGSEEVLKNIGYTFRISSINKMIMFLENLSDEKIKQKSMLARKFAIKNFNNEVIKNQYLKIFKSINKQKLN